MNGTKEQWQNYVSWLDERGLSYPRWVEAPAMALSPESDVTPFKAVFISDLPLKESEQQLLEKMAKALHLASHQWDSIPAVPNADILHAGVPDAATLDHLALSLSKRLPAAQVFVAFGPLATRIACGKGSFSEMRGRLLDCDSRNILVTYHPRDLLKRLDLKRDAWTDLQIITPCLHS